MARSGVGRGARVCAAKARCEPAAVAADPAARATSGAVGTRACAARPSARRWWSGRSASVPSTRSCVIAWIVSSRARRCCASTSTQPAIRSTRSRSPACSPQRSIRRSRCPCRKRWTSWFGAGCPGCRRRHARGARACCCRPDAVGVSARARRRRAGGARAGRRGRCDRARTRDDPLHSPAAGIRRLRPERARTAGGAGRGPARPRTASCAGHRLAPGGRRAHGRAGGAAGHGARRGSPRGGAGRACAAAHAGDGWPTVAIAGRSRRHVRIEPQASGRAPGISRVRCSPSRAPGPQRAEVLVLLSEFEVDEQAVPLLEEALTEATGRPELHLEIRLLLAVCRRFTRGFGAGFEDAPSGAGRCGGARRRRTAGLGAEHGGVPGPDWSRARGPRVCRGGAGDREPERRSRAPKRSAAVLGQVLLDRGEYEAARAALERDYDYWRERDERFAAGLLWSLAWLELWSGNLERAADHAARSQEIVVQYGVEEHSEPLPGGLDRRLPWPAGAGARARGARARALPGADPRRRPLVPGVLGLVAFWGGDAASGVAQFAEADRLAFAVDWRNPHKRPWTPALRRGTARARPHRRRDTRARRLGGGRAALGLPRIFAQVTRCRGLIAAAEGRVDEAERCSSRPSLSTSSSATGSAARAPCSRWASCGDVSGRGGQLGARSRRRSSHSPNSARRSGPSALGRSSAGSAAAPARRGLRPPSTASQRSSPRAGTNREVAAALFLGERTVETHLTHVYAKLDVRSRAELARVYHPDPEEAGQSSGGSAISS